MISCTIVVQQIQGGGVLNSKGSCQGVRGEDKVHISTSKEEEGRKRKERGY